MRASNFSVFRSLLLTSSQYLIRRIPCAIRWFSNSGQTSRKCLLSSFVQKPYDIFHAGTVVPTPVENHDLTGCREMHKVSLPIHLGFLAI